MLKSRAWRISKQSVNCGSVKCLRGCYDLVTEEFTDVRAHGPYYTLMRRKTDPDTAVIFERFRVGKFCPTAAELGSINKFLSDGIPADVWNDRVARAKRVAEMRDFIARVMRVRGVEQEDLTSIHAERNKHWSGEDG